MSVENPCCGGAMLHAYNCPRRSDESRLKQFLAGTKWTQEEQAKMCAEDYNSLGLAVPPPILNIRKVLFEPNVFVTVTVYQPFHEMKTKVTLTCPQLEEQPEPKICSICKGPITNGWCRCING